MATRVYSAILNSKYLTIVIPTKVGIQAKQQARAADKIVAVSLREVNLIIWIPTFVGMTGGVGA